MVIYPLTDGTASDADAQGRSNGQVTVFSSEEEHRRLSKTRSSSMILSSSLFRLLLVCTVNFVAATVYMYATATMFVWLVTGTFECEQQLDESNSWRCERYWSRAHALFTGYPEVVSYSWGRTLYDLTVTTPITQSIPLVMVWISTNGKVQEVHSLTVILGLQMSSIATCSLTVIGELLVDHRLIYWNYIAPLLLTFAFAKIHLDFLVHKKKTKITLATAEKGDKARDNDKMRCNAGENNVCTNQQTAKLGSSNGWRGTRIVAGDSTPTAFLPPGTDEVVEGSHQEESTKITTTVRYTATCGEEMKQTHSYEQQKGPITTSTKPKHHLTHAVGSSTRDRNTEEGASRVHKDLAAASRGLSNWGRAEHQPITMLRRPNRKELKLMSYIAFPSLAAIGCGQLIAKAVLPMHIKLIATEGSTHVTRVLFSSIAIPSAVFFFQTVLRIISYRLHHEGLFTFGKLHRNLFPQIFIFNLVVLCQQQLLCYGDLSYVAGVCFLSATISLAALLSISIRDSCLGLRALRSKRLSTSSSSTGCNSHEKSTRSSFSTPRRSSSADFLQNPHAGRTASPRVLDSSTFGSREPDKDGRTLRASGVGGNTIPRLEQVSQGNGLHHQGVSQKNCRSAAVTSDKLIGPPRKPGGSAATPGMMTVSRAVYLYVAFVMIFSRFAGIGLSAGIELKTMEIILGEANPQVTNGDVYTLAIRSVTPSVLTQLAVTVLQAIALIYLLQRVVKIDVLQYWASTSKKYFLPGILILPFVIGPFACSHGLIYAIKRGTYFAQQQP